PEIREELRAWMRSQKFSMDPARVIDYSQAHMIPAAVEKHARNQVKNNLPDRLRSYINLTLFPHIEWKPSKGISKRTVRRWLKKEGFKWTRHKKGLYYDGHERPDVVKYSQEVFIPTFLSFLLHMCQYSLADNPQEIIKPLPLGVNPVVLVVHDETTCTSKDGNSHSWVLEGQGKLRKKGQGRGGIHQSDFLCSTFGHLAEAGVQIEYGKNHDGFWTGEQMLDQVCALFAHFRALKDHQTGQN
ncbi:hypothetical protein BT69DRAFT_1213772, partial [Atractiella rhizophila]